MIELCSSCTIVGYDPAPHAPPTCIPVSFEYSISLNDNDKESIDK